MRQRIAFGGLRSDIHDVLVPFEQAIDASDCVVDDGTLTGRAGYTNIGSGAMGSGTPQGLWRHRVSPTSAWTMAVIGGKVHKITDGTPHTIDSGYSHFLDSHKVSAAQLGGTMYIASDGAPETYPVVRVSNTGTLTTLTDTPSPVAPTLSSISSAMTPVEFSTLSRTRINVGSTLVYERSITVTVAGTSRTYYELGRRATGGAGTDTITSNAVAGEGITIDLGTATDHTSKSWLLLAAGPDHFNAGPDPLLVEVGNSSSVFASVGTLKHDGSGGNPGGLAYLNLSSVPSSILSDLKYIRMTLASEGVFVYYAYALVSQTPGLGDSKYRTTILPTSTGAESAPSPELTVNIPSPTASSFPRFAMLCYLDGATNPQSTLGSVSSDPVTIGSYNVNKTSGLATPSREEFAGFPTILAQVPTALQNTATRVERLWRMTAAGWRLAKEQAFSTTPATTDSIPDIMGPDSILAASQWKPSGTRSQCTAMAAKDQRLILGYQNTLYISTFVAPNADSSTRPNFPAIAMEESDGWQFDITPSPTEQIQGMVVSDDLYISTSRAVYGMDSLIPNSPCTCLVRTGALGRYSMVAAEDSVFVAARQGVFAILGRVSAGSGQRRPQYITDAVRRSYVDWLAPTSAVVLTYRNRRLYVIEGQKFMVLNMQTGQWFRGTFGKSVSIAGSWVDPSSADDTVWLMMSDRNIEAMDDDATTDDGTSIPDWSYQTGYQRFDGTKARMGLCLSDVTGDVGIEFRASESGLSDRRSRVLEADSAECDVTKPLASDASSMKWSALVTGANTTQVRYIEVEFLPTEGK